MLWPKFLLPFLLLLCCCRTAAGQSVLAIPDSAGLVQSQVKRIGINTYTGYNQLVSSSATDSQQVVLRFGHNWIYNATPTINGFVRKDYLLNLHHRQRLGGSGAWAGQRLDFSEYQANRASIMRLLQEVTWQLQPDSLWRLQTNVFGGIRRDERFGIVDFGPEVGGALQAFMDPAPGIGSAGAGLHVNHAQLGPRHFRRVQADAVYASPADMPAAVELRGGYFTVYSADYLSGNVQSIRSDTLFGSLRLDYRINRWLTLRSESMGAMPGRLFTYHQQPEGVPEQQNFAYEQLQLETANRLRYRHNKLEAQVEFIYRERNRIYRLQNNRNLSGPELRQAEERERIKDIKESYTIWNWSVVWNWSRKHTVSLQTTAQLLRLDTPSEQNTQDRDEVYYLGKLSLESRWSPSFQTWLAIAADDKQFVFLNAQQSIENYQDRVFRWEPGFAWVHRQFSWKGSVQLWATYHVRAADTEQLKNRSTRTYQQVHQLAYELPRRYRASLHYTRRENRTGLLNWANFSESPLDTTISHDLSLGIEKRLLRKEGATVFRAGYRLFYQAQHRQAGLEVPSAGTRLIYLRDITRQHGPEAALQHRLDSRLDVSASLWLQVVDTYSRYRQTDEVFVGNIVSQQQLSQRLHAVYPYFSVSLSWYFGGLVKKVIR